MATWVYKDGKGDLVDAHSVGHHLDAGYTLENKPVEEVVEAAPVEEVVATKKAKKKNVH